MNQKWNKNWKNFRNQIELRRNQLNSSSPDRWIIDKNEYTKTNRFTFLHIKHEDRNIQNSATDGYYFDPQATKANRLSPQRRKIALRYLTSDSHLPSQTKILVWIGEPIINAIKSRGLSNLLSIELFNWTVFQGRQKMTPTTSKLIPLIHSSSTERSSTDDIFKALAAHENYIHRCV